MSFTDAFKVGPDNPINLSSFDTAQTAGFEKDKKTKKVFK